MNYYSLNQKTPLTTFENAVIQGIAPDKGLYFPEYIPTLPQDFWDNIENLTHPQIAFEMLKPFIGEAIDDISLRKIIQDVLSFEFPVVQLEDNVATLELFHGPTMAFKDVGARFMAKCLSYFLNKKKHSKNVTVLVATSGDTGGAVARGFYKVPGIDVVILYPSGKVSKVQEKQLTTLGHNIKALEVTGDFDQCQAMVKTAFIDTQITNLRQLTSANSINIARWLPQSIYYAFAYKALKKKGKKLVFAVPSGNFGNICAGMLAHHMGMPVHQFIAAVNNNDTIHRYMLNGTYAPSKTIPTISNAMDVSDPSNFVRILELFEKNRNTLSRKLKTYSFDDHCTRKAMKKLHTELKYVADPHGAIGYLGAKEYLKECPDAYGVFLETAHPVKFLPVVEPIVGKINDLPTQIKELMPLKKEALPIKNYEEFKSFLIENS